MVVTKHVQPGCKEKLIQNRVVCIRCPGKNHLPTCAAPPGLFRLLVLASRSTARAGAVGALSLCHLSGVSGETPAGMCAYFGVAPQYATRQ